MAEKVRYHCNNCGHQWETTLLDEGEVREAERRGEYVPPLSCPKCRRRDYRKISN
jgi:rubredoxin